MKTKFLIPFIIFVLLNMSIDKAKAQNLSNYNLYSQNAFLYNPAAAIEKTGISAFVNSHLQWVGFDGAPKTNTFGISESIMKSMGIGLIVTNNIQNIQNDFSSRLSYGYRVEVAENHILLLGASLGFLSNKLSLSDAQINLNDPSLISSDYTQKSLMANAGLIYYYKNLEVQFVLPQLAEKKTADFYSISMVSYTLGDRSSWAFKPSILARGNNTTPWQMDMNLTVMNRNAIWGQVGYRTNNSFLFGFGVNYKKTKIAYVYEMDNNVLASVSKGTHELQISVNFGNSLFASRPKTSHFSGVIKDTFTGTGIPNATVVITNDKGEEVERAVSDSDGMYSSVLKLNQSYTVSVTAKEHTKAKELVAIGKTETNKTLDLMLKPTKITLKGHVVPQNAKIKITDETGHPLFAGTADQNGDYQMKVDIGKSYKVELTADNYVSKSETIVTNQNRNEYNLNTSLIAYKKLIAKLINKDTREPIEATISIYDKIGKIIDTKEVNGTYQIKLAPGTYKIEIKSVDINTIKQDLVIKDDTEKEYPIEVKAHYEKLIAKLINKDTGKPVAATTTIYDNTGKLIDTKKVTGTYQIKLTPGTYKIEIKGSGILPMNQKLVIKEDTKKEYAIEIKVKTLSKNSTFQLGNIAFLSGTSKLTPASYPVLDKLVEMMKEDESLKLEVGGHTDDIGSAAANLKLSMKRANSVMSYVLSKGIAKERLSAKGYGESKPLVPNTSSKNRAKNRRVEFKVQ